MASVFLGALAVGAVLVLSFPGSLSTERFRPLYPLSALRSLIQGVIVVSFLAGVMSLLLRRRKVLGATGCALSLAAALVGGGNAPARAEGAVAATLGLDWFLLNLFLLAVLFVPSSGSFLASQTSVTSGPSGRPTAFTSSSATPSSRR